MGFPGTCKCVPKLEGRGALCPGCCCHTSPWQRGHMEMHLQKKCFVFGRGQLSPACSYFQRHVLGRVPHGPDHQALSHHAAHGLSSAKE